MSLYVGIDLHSTNSYIGIIDDKQNKILGLRMPNDKIKIIRTLERYRKDISGIVVESTYNWYWLVDALMMENFKVHLANPAAIQQYKGIKYLNDKQDAFWLAQMLQLGILAEGYIYPKETRGIRDLLRHRSRLVNKQSSLKCMLQQIGANQTGIRIGSNLERTKSTNDLDRYFETGDWQFHAQSLLESILFLKDKIKKTEDYVLTKMKEEPAYVGLQSIPGIGKVLALTIALETGPIERFKTASHYSSYCRCVPSSYWSNEKKKGCGNAKNGNKYLSWAYAEAANFCIRYSSDAKAYYQRKAANSIKPKAYRSIANKISKAAYYIMRDGCEFDSKKLFGC